MGLKIFIFGLVAIGCATAQSPYKVCVPTSVTQSVCQSLQRDDSRVQCETVATRVDCALMLARGEVDLGVFSEEEMLLLSQMQPNSHRVVGEIRHQSRTDQFAFEAVAVVSSSFTGGLEGLRNSGFCHPGFDQRDQRWSPRVLRTLEQRAARTDRCTEESTSGKAFEELEVETLSQFFRAACRPGRWSANATLDAQLKRNYPNLCSLCNSTGNSATCDNGYEYDMGLLIGGVNNNNRHIRALECLVRYGGNVTYVAWQHTREYFLNRASDVISNYALLCEDGSIQTLTSDNLANPISPCSWIRQPWSALVASTNNALPLLTELKGWWPAGAMPNAQNWQFLLYDILVGGADLRITFRDDMPSALNYVTPARTLADIDSTTSCMPVRRWCTINDEEHTKCLWVRRAAYILGAEPAMSCQQRPAVFQCLEDIRDSRADFISLDSNYGYLARVRYSLSPVKLLQNSHPNSSRITTLIKQSSAASQEITRFENLRDKRACFPEFGGIAYVAFIRAAHDRSIISDRECDYARAVGEFFAGACAPGALSTTHSITENSEFNASVLCTSCRSSLTTPGWPDFTCAADYSNQFYATNGTISCLADPANDVAFIETQNLQKHISDLNLNASHFRALCSNNTLALEPGVTVDDNCLIALVINEEILTRRNDPQFSSLSSLLELLDFHFGYNAAITNQLINLEIFSPFDKKNNLLFLDTSIGLAEPSATSTHVPARNYFELFSHLEQCSGAPGMADSKTLLSFVSLILMAAFSKWVL